MVDLGSGAGRDCFLLSKLVGPTGYVTGVDMTPEQVSKDEVFWSTDQVRKRFVCLMKVQ